MDHSIASKVGPNQCLRMRGPGAFYNACCVRDMRLRGVNSLLCRGPWTFLLLHDSGFPPTPIPKLEYCRGVGVGAAFCCHECTVQIKQVFCAKDIVAKSHCFTERLKILGIVSHQTLIISLQNWVKDSLFNDIYYSLL